MGIITRIVRGDLVQVVGRAATGRQRTPVVPDLHDFRQWLAAARALTPERAQALEWRAYEADRGFAALLDLSAPWGKVAVSIVTGRGVPAPGEVDGWRLHGETGTLQADRQGAFSYAVSRIAGRGSPPEALPVPQRLLNALPQVGNDEQNKWCALYREVVADVRGEPHQPYLTFRDGWRYQVAIDAIRTGKGWTALPDDAACPKQDMAHEGGNDVSRSDAH